MGRFVRFLKALYDKRKLEGNNEELLINNEIQANKLFGFSMIFLGVAVCLVWILNELGVFAVRKELLRGVAWQTMLFALILFILSRVLKGNQKWLKYLMMVSLIFMLARVDVALTYNVTMIMILPVVLSCRYFNKIFTIETIFMTALGFFLSALITTYFDYAVVDLNFVVFNDLEFVDFKAYIYDLEDILDTLNYTTQDRVSAYLTLSYLPKLLVFLIISNVCVYISKKGRDLILAQKDIVERDAKIASELNLAKDIQTNMLPTIFPPFPNKEEVDIYATMEPAKEVGGDFYDFYMLDDDHVGFVIADVSGKGVPAALFMSITKTLIKNEATLGLSPGFIFSKVNHMLTEENESNMFVTSWLGILDLKTGILTYSNAGHNPPLIYHNGTYEYLKGKPQMVLGAFDGMKYKDFEIKLDEGDKVFLYTDGVTESINNTKEQFGEERLLNYLNQNKEATLMDTLKGLREDIRVFAEDAEQFDDITMLIMYFKKLMENTNQKEIKFNTKTETFTDVSNILEKELEELDLSLKVTNAILISTEEIFTNIKNHAYKDSSGDAFIIYEIKDDYFELTFKDFGIPFNPLLKEDPDINAKLEDRKEGGLGIYMVKKMMDDVSYEYKNGMNILKIRKKIKE